MPPRLDPPKRPRKPRGRPRVIDGRRLVGLHLDAGHDAFLTAEAKRRGESRSALVREALDLYRIALERCADEDDT